MTRWRENADKARKTAIDKADKEAEQELNELIAAANTLQRIFKEIKLADQETYDQLITVVERATARNESIATVVGRLKALGEAGRKLAATAAGNLSGSSALKMFLEALKES